MNSLIGLWLFTSIFYQGQPGPIPNDKLKIYYSFQNEFVNEIYYYRTNETGFCRRWANYQATDSVITQTIDRLDPDNSSSCDSDTDMQLGNSSKVHYEIKDEKLHLYMPLGDEEIQYIFERIN